MPSSLEVAWLAGLLEGEGSFAHNHGSPGITVEMTDEDVVRRAAVLLRGESYEPPIRDLPSGKRTWRVAVHGKRAAGWMMTLFPLLGERRQTRIAAVLATWREQLPVGKYGTTKTHCKRGHAFTPENTRTTKTGGRQCRACDIIRSRKSRDIHDNRLVVCFPFSRCDGKDGQGDQPPGGTQP